MGRREPCVFQGLLYFLRAGEARKTPEYGLKFLLLLKAKGVEIHCPVSKVALNNPETVNVSGMQVEGLSYKLGVEISTGSPKPTEERGPLCYASDDDRGDSSHLGFSCVTFL